MNKDEATVLAQKAVRTMRADAMSYVKKHGGGRPPRSVSTGELMRSLDLKISDWASRSKVKSALTRALREAVDLGLIERERYSTEARWRYVGPEIKQATIHYNKRVADERRSLAHDLKTLGLPIRCARGAHNPDDRLDLTVKDIRKTAELHRKINQAWGGETKKRKK